MVHILTFLTGFRASTEEQSTSAQASPPPARLRGTSPRPQVPPSPSSISPTHCRGCHCGPAVLGDPRGVEATQRWWGERGREEGEGRRKEGECEWRSGATSLSLLSRLIAKVKPHVHVHVHVQKCLPYSFTQ